MKISDELNKKLVKAADQYLENISLIVNKKNISEQIFLMQKSIEMATAMFYAECAPTEESILDILPGMEKRILSLACELFDIRERIN